MNLHLLLCNYLLFYLSFFCKIKTPTTMIVIRVTFHYITYALIKAKTKNSVPVITVPRCNTRSKPLAFCLPNNCSAPPEIAPERPSLLPDCNNTNTIIIIASTTNNIFTTLPMFILNLLLVQNTYKYLLITLAQFQFI